MDTFLAIASRRDVKLYEPRPVPDEVARRILDAGRLAGSARNRQPWRFVVVRNEELRRALAETVYVPENVLGAGLVVALAAPAGGGGAFDCGRAAQSMLLAAWNEGIASSPNGVHDPTRATELLGLGDEWAPQAVLTFGYPARIVDPGSRTPEEWSARANRLPLEEVARAL
jgi:nitroreductase